MSYRYWKGIAWILAILAVLWVIKGNSEELDPGPHGSLITNEDVQAAFIRFDNQAYDATKLGVDQATTDGMVLMYVSGLIDSRTLAAGDVCGSDYKSLLLSDRDILELAWLTALVMIEDERGDEPFKYSALPWYFSFTCEE